MRKWIGGSLLLLLLGWAPLPLRADETPEPSPGCRQMQLRSGRPLERTLTVDRTPRRFLLDAPDSLVPGEPVPLLLDFHGFGHSGRGLWRVSRFRDFAPTRRFLTAYPEGLDVHLLGRDGPGWDVRTPNGNREVRFVRALLDSLEAEFCIDRRRVYSTGFSNGGFLSSLLACELPDRIAAIAPVGGGEPPLPCTTAPAMPVIIHHGRNDEIVPVERARALRDAWARRNGCPGAGEPDGPCLRQTGCRKGVEVVYCEDDGRHRWPPAATERIWEFLSRWRLPPASERLSREALPQAKRE